MDVFFGFSVGFFVGAFCRVAVQIAWPWWNDQKKSWDEKKAALTNDAPSSDESLNTEETK